MTARSDFRPKGHRIIARLGKKGRKNTMKKLNKVFVLVMAVIMTLAMSATAFAATQTVAKDPADADNAKITINNPAKGETYKLYKLFDATVSADGQISYQGTVPSSLSAYFEADNLGNISPKGEIVETDASGKVTTKMTDNLKRDLETWAKSADATEVNHAESDGSEALEFTGLPYGYYVMVTTHLNDPVAQAKSLISVTSTMPNATINDKNVNEPSAEKTVENVSYSIGDTIKYTAIFDTTNYLGEGENSKQVVEYVIEDTLPAYLGNVKVTSIKIGGADATLQQFDANKQITIPWATKDTSVTPAKFTSLYKQGAKIEIKYEAVLTSTTNINKADKNTVTISANVDNDQGDKKPWEDRWSDDAEITTYAAALIKTDGTNALAGAKFRFAGLKATKTDNGVYTVDSYEAPATAPTSKDDLDDTNSTEMEVNADGMLYIVGLAEDVSLTGFETVAPEGYNLASSAVILTPQVLSKQIYKLSGYEKYDADGNLIEHRESSSTDFVQVTQNLSELDAAAVEVENKPGVVLPGTGGIGTTIFYILGSLLVVGCGIVLISRKRMENNK